MKDFTNYNNPPDTPQTTVRRTGATPRCPGNGGNLTPRFTYDRNRLATAVTDGVTGSYNYDPFGRLDTVFSADQIVEHYAYDGFDRTTKHRTLDDTGAIVDTTYRYDPLDRTTSKTDHAGTADAKTTDFAYLGLTDKVVAEEIAGQLQRTYQYDAYGRRLTQNKKDTDGGGPEVAEDAFYGYNPHTDVETLTTSIGDTKATYGYTAYGNDDTEAFTGVDKPDAQQPGKEPFNYYRYTGKRFDPASGGYDMGFRDYQPGINRFTVRDTYNGAMADLNLTTNPWTGNRYSIAGGNPITGIEIDGHRYLLGDCVCGSTPQQIKHAVQAVEDAGAENEWIRENSPQSVDDPTQLASLWSAQYGATDRDFWRMGMGGGENACFGRKGCQEAWRHILDHPDDVAGAKRIAATYCLDHFEECGQEGEFEHAVNAHVETALFALLGLRLGASGGRAANTLGGYGNPMAIVPKGASMRRLTPSSTGGSQVGVEYKWVNKQGQTIRLRAHDADLTAPLGSNAASGPTYRIQVGGRYADAQGNLYPRGVHNPNSPNYDPAAANATHIPWPGGIPLPW
ncbi:polymorphic toxin type 30 domain-containing protein [Actinophytocola gossypii]|uniref:Bacterial toxin 30 domain-containing protein n=1 Tax=Actinophytocola gossypii TaxID=2812003 RepID=A0ABT2JJ65_9PSEU|nr:polymorphic toxin type 30 domain-containing protein [Actinophytocola gossypii]MCT2587923.1 hypothetical protein [Actinophytocola gossypii]